MNLSIIEDLHVLWENGDGHSCIGIKVKDNNAPQLGTPEAWKWPYQREWYINEHTILRSDPEDLMTKLNLSRDEYCDLIERTKKMVEETNNETTNN